MRLIAMRDGVVHGATPTPDRFGRPDRAFAFDGVDDYIAISPPLPLTRGALSVSAWIRCEPRDFSGWTNCIVAQDDGDDNDPARRVFQLSLDSGHVVWHQMGGEARDPMCRRRVRPGTWHHVAAVHHRGVSRVYLDGVLHDTVEQTLRRHDTQPIHIGRKGTPEPSFYFRGAIDDVRLYDVGLGDDEIAALCHENGWQPPALADLPVAGDPVSGHWGRDGVVFLDLRYDGRNSVAGQIMNGRPGNMAAIAEGSFDRATAALRVAGTARDSRTSRVEAFTIEGMWHAGEVTVCARFAGFAGNFILTKSGARLRLSLRSLRSHWEALNFRLRGSRRSPAQRE
jgi:hypothetical protein